MPGYEPFLLCDFHVHTRWSDGRLSLRETIDLYGRTGKFDVIAITDHILMKKDWLARAGRVATLGRRTFGIAEDHFKAYLEDVKREAERARRQYDMLVVPGAEITQNKLRGKKNAHIIALDIKSYISADQTPDAILTEIRRQDAVSVACHPHHRAVRRLEISTCYLWDNRKVLAPLVDVWEAANRDDLFSVTSLKHFPYVASSDFHKPKHLYSWKTLLRADKSWPAVRKALCENVDVALTLFRKDSWTNGTASAPHHASARRVVVAASPSCPRPGVGSAVRGRWSVGRLEVQWADVPRLEPHGRRPPGADGRSANSTVEVRNRPHRQFGHL